MEPPVLVKPIPAQIINEQAAYGPFDVSVFFQKGEDSSPLRFHAGLTSGQPLPKGLICTGDGILTGIPARGTQGNHEVTITASNDAGNTPAIFMLTIKPSLVEAGTEYFDQLKTQVWAALEQNLPVPDLAELYNRGLSVGDINYLLERWGILTVWDALNLEPASEKSLLQLEGASEHYDVYDRGSCLIACPKDLFSHERTMEDGLKTARAMAREVYQREWTVELSGVDKMVRAAWVEIQHLNDKYGRQLEVINFEPRVEDVKLYTEQAQQLGLSGGAE